MKYGLFLYMGRIKPFSKIIFLLQLSGQVDCSELKLDPSPVEGLKNFVHSFTRPQKYRTTEYSSKFINIAKNHLPQSETALTSLQAMEKCYEFSVAFRMEFFSNVERENHKKDKKVSMIGRRVNFKSTVQLPIRRHSALVAC